MVVHAEDHGYLPNWSGMLILHASMGRRMRMVEAFHITTAEVTNHGGGFVALPHITAGLINAAAGGQP